MWSLTTSEILNQCIEDNLWTKVDEFLKQPGSTQRFLLETKAKRTLAEDRLPNFDLYIDDSDEKETYRIEYENEGLVSNAVYSDAQLKLFRTTSQTEYVEYRIAVIVKSALNSEHDDETINRVITMAESHPTVFFSLGLPNLARLELEEKFARLNDKYIQYYPIAMLNIPKELFGPLILVPAEENEPLRKLKSTIKAWGTHVTNHRNELLYFINNLPKEIIERMVRLKAYELIKSEIEIEQQPVIEATDNAAMVLNSLKDDAVIGTKKPEDKSKKLSEAGKFFGASLIAIIDTIKSYKYQPTIEKELKKMLSTSPYREFENALFNILNKYIDVLQDELIITTGSRGGKRIIEKTESWDEKIALAAINKHFDKK
jgi:hypothetical protein